MFCLVALIVFSIMGIFSATHRKFAKEAFDCVFRRITLRPCNTGFREKVRGIILVKLMKHSSFFARIFNKYFEVIAWIFFIIMITSTAYAIRGAYNFYLYGNCSGLNQEGFCLFDPTGENNKLSPITESCSIETPTVSDLNMENLDLSKLWYIDNGSDNTVVFIGCFACKYTRKVYPEIMKLLKKEKPNIYFGHLPINKDYKFSSKYDYCASKDPSGDYWKFINLMFNSKVENINNREHLDEVIKKAEFNISSIKECVDSPDTESLLNENIANIENTNIYGTPLIFINEIPLIGPKPYRVYKSLLK